MSDMPQGERGEWSPAVAPAVDPTVARHNHPFQFTGKTTEFFRIWIVNVVLSVLTAGIYSAWAKVRTRQYFYRHTHVDGNSFEYLANPLSILKGRLIVGAFLVLMFASQHYSITLYLSMLAVLLLASPYLIVQSLRFNARNSAYRNVRFSFGGSVGEAYGVFALTSLLSVVTLGLAYPYALWRLTQFFVTRHLYGDQRFEWGARSGQYYRILLVPVLAQLGLLAVVAAAIGIAAATNSGSEESSMPAWFSGLALLLLVVVYAGMFALAAYVKARTFNLVYNETSLGSHRFASSQRARDLLSLYVVNAIGVVVSLGLLAPWAKIRLARYAAEHLTFIAVGSTIAGYNPMAADTSALGDAAVDLGDVGFDFGI